MSSLTEKDLIPLVNEIKLITSNYNYKLAYSRIDDTWALQLDGSDACGQNYVPACDLYEQMVAFINGIKVGIALKGSCKWTAGVGDWYYSQCGRHIIKEARGNFCICCGKPVVLIQNP